MRADTNIGMRRRMSFVLIGCEKSGQYRARKKDLVRRDTVSRMLEYKHVSYVGIDSSRCGCVMRTTHDLSCACKLARYVVGNIPLGVVHMFWRRLNFSNLGLSEPKISITEDMETISKRFQELDVCGLENCLP